MWDKRVKRNVLARFIATCIERTFILSFIIKYISQFIRVRFSTRCACTWMVVNPPSDGGTGAGAGVEAVEALEATLAADSLLLSAAEHFLSFIPSFLRIGHFAAVCLLP